MRTINIAGVNVLVYDQHESACKALAEEIVGISKIIGNTSIYMNMSGGTTINLVERLLTNDYRNDISWKRIHIFWGDEHSDQSNMRLALEEGGLKALINDGMLPRENVHPINLLDTDDLAEGRKAAINYAKEIRETLGQSSFDISIIGLGRDYHTMSLLPQREPFVNHAFSSDQLVEAVNYPIGIYPGGGLRVTMTPQCLKTLSQKNVMLVTGVDKSIALREILSGEVNLRQKPGSLIRLLKDPIVITDEEAASLL